MSVAHFATGLELLLKARLYAVHWTLIADDPHKCKWSDLKNGTGKTIQASNLCKTINTVTDTHLSRASAAFEPVFAHRNRVLHWLPSPDREMIALEQMKAWHELQILLLGVWRDVFGAVEVRVTRVEHSMRRHAKYLKTRYEAIGEGVLRGAKHQGRLRTCSQCGYEAAVVDDREHVVAKCECLVCEHDLLVVRFACTARVPLLDLPIECHCGAEHTHEEVIEMLQPEKELSPKESLIERDPARCGECCGDLPVVALEAALLCVECGLTFGSLESCERCGADWVGLDLDGSGQLGCPSCSW